MGSTLVKTQTLLDAVAVAGASGPQALPPGKKIFQIAGTFVGTVKIQGSVDGANWVDLYSNTAPAVVEVDDVFPKHRANVTAYTSGNISVTAAWPQ